MSRIPLAYPKIAGSAAAPSGRCIAFDKCDGTNLHWVWSVERDWFAFGTRRDRFSLDAIGIDQFNAAHPELAEAPDVFRRDLADQIEEVFCENPMFDSDEITVFTEFLGDGSFAGRHRKADEKRLVLFDVQTEYGLLGPDRFLKEFRHLPTPRVIYRGKLTGAFTEDVRRGRYDVTEGVVCKGTAGEIDPWMVKIKTDAYQERLKIAFASDWESHWE